ncbi:LysR family transcriptional regulator [Streptomyces sp. HUAS TT7]|uniref:LysR family transcriptional regulator n=1 Tax=Streptomyces sp. HUAS TT7 TaxID=3447507 RepID=UPI003F657774
MQQLPDMNLLPSLDALLRAGSVAGAAAEMRISPSAMSRTLGRLRRVVGDELLVPSGRGLTLTPRARELQPRVEAALAAALAALRPPQELELATLQREFTIRSNDSVAVIFGSALTERVMREAPGVRLRMLPEGDEDPADLRDRIDLEVGQMHDLPHDIRSSPLGEYAYAAVVRADGPYAAERLTPERFAALPHITVTRRGRVRSVVDERLAELGLTRDVLATAPTYSAACFFALRSDALALVPRQFAVEAVRAMPLTILDIPLGLPASPFVQAWHIRVDADPAHRWLRGALADIVAGVSGAGGPGPGPYGRTESGAAGAASPSVP